MTAHLNYNPQLPHKFDSLMPDWLDQITLLDVGCSGGIPNHWPQVFGERLHALGVDPLVNEIRRLQAEKHPPHVDYIDGFVTCNSCEKDGAAGISYHRYSSVYATELMQMNYTHDVFNSGQAVVMSDHSYTVSELAQTQIKTPIDFIKIDTDGHDFIVLQGAADVFARGQVLGIEVEVQLHGAPTPHSNTFSNIDALLRAAGFTLFDLDIYRYSHRDLPAPFQYDIPASTVTGQVVFGDAVYFRNLAELNDAALEHIGLSERHVLKLAALFELYGFPDHAVHLLKHFAERYRYGQHLNALLDALTPSWDGQAQTYAEAMARFTQNPRSFYPSSLNNYQTQALATQHSVRHLAGALMQRLVRRLRARF